MRTTIVVPPGAGGVVDYAHAICARMPESICVPFAPKLRVESERVLIEYSGYGFQPRGVALDLLTWVNKLGPSQTVGTYFHELSASGWPWQSAFWLSPLQRYVSRQLQKRSAFWLTNTSIHHNRLLQSDGNKPNVQLPVCSNVGELRDYYPQKQSVLVIFGSAPLRERLYRLNGNLVAEFCSNNNLEVWDIGPTIDSANFTAFNSAGVAFKAFGKLATDDVHKRLSAASFGAVHYPIPHLDKSGVFAAYCAHAICPLVLSPGLRQHQNRQASGADSQFWHGLITPHVIAKTLAERLGQHALKRYMNHNIQCHADHCLKMFNRFTPGAT